VSLDIIQVPKTVLERISAKLWWHFIAALPPKNKDITKIFRLRKALISWIFNQVNPLFDIERYGFLSGQSIYRALLLEKDWMKSSD